MTEHIEPRHADGDEEKGDPDKEKCASDDDNNPNQNAAMSACLRTFQAAQAEMSQLINLIDLSRREQYVSVERVTKTSPLRVSIIIKFIPPGSHQTRRSRFTPPPHHCNNSSSILRHVVAPLDESCTLIMNRSLSYSCMSPANAIRLDNGTTGTTPF